MVFFEKRGHRLKTYLAPTIIISSLEFSVFYIFLFLFLQLIDSWSMIAHTPHNESHGIMEADVSSRFDQTLLKLYSFPMGGGTRPTHDSDRFVDRSS